MNTCDIDKLRDLVIRQARAKVSFYSHPYGTSERLSLQTIDPVEVERQLCTYLSQGTTVTALTKCVEQIEQEALDRMKKEKAQVGERERKERILRVCYTAAELFKDNPKTKLWEYGYHGHNSLSNDIDQIKQELADVPS